jgi:hypothetical protein
LTDALDRSSSELSFSEDSGCCVLCSSALAAFGIMSLQVAPGLPLGHQGAGEIAQRHRTWPASEPQRHAYGPGETGFPAGICCRLKSLHRESV